MEKDSVKVVELLDPCTSNVGYYLTRDMNPRNGFPVRYFASCFLDDPKKMLPICKIRNPILVCDRIRFAMTPFPTKDEDADQHGYLLSDVIKGDVLDKDEDLVDLCLDFFPYLSLQIPALNDVTYESLYRDLTGYEATHATRYSYLKYLDVHQDPLYIDEAGHYRIGKGVFKPYGDIAISKESFKMWETKFLLHFHLPALPLFLYDISFRKIPSGKFNNGRFSVTVYYADNGIKKYRSIAIRPRQNEEWAALTYVFASVLRSFGAIDPVKKYEKCFFCHMENPDHPGRICYRNPHNKATIGKSFFFH